MANELRNKYFIKRLQGGSWSDITTLFDGVRVLKLGGMNEVGEAVNVYTEQWVGSQEEDYMCVGDVVVRKNVDLEMSFIVGTRYSSNRNADTQTVYDAFKDYICNHGDFYVKSAYSGKYAHVVCLKGISVVTERLHRGVNSYILATATLHCLGEPSV